MNALHWFIVIGSIVLITWAGLEVIHFVKPQALDPLREIWSTIF